MRLQKYLADAGIASRRKCEEIISAGRVKVNGHVAVLGSSVEPEDSVTLDDKPVHLAEERIVIAFNKPKNVICSNADSEDRVKVTDFFSELPYRLYTIGRLDYDSEGLILVTNDGETANRLMHPRYGANKTYRVLCTGELSRSECRALERGIQLDDGLTAPARVRILRSHDVTSFKLIPFIKQLNDEKTELLLMIHEGRNRQVRRMLAALGHDTLRLQRVGIGALTLNGLKPGQWRYITQEELEMLLK